MPRTALLTLVLVFASRVAWASPGASTPISPDNGEGFPPWLSSPLVAPPAFETVGDSRAVPNGIVTALVQDRAGFLWLGSTDGLLRYDGYGFTRIAIEDLPEIYVRALMPARDGRLWVALQGAGVVIRDPETGRVTRPAEGTNAGERLAEGDVVSMVEDSDGSVWAAHAQGGLEHVAAGGASLGAFVPEVSLRTLAFDRRGDLWMGGRGVLMRRRSGSNTFETIAGFEGQYVYSIYASSDDRLWVGTQAHGAAVVDPETGAVQRLPLWPDPQGVSHPWVDGFVERVPGELWLATFGGGLEVRDLATHRLLRNLRHVPGQAGGLAMDRVPTLLLDRSGLLWVPTWGAGLQRMAAGDGAVQVLYPNPEKEGSLRHPNVLSTLPMPNGELWVGSGGFGIDVLDVRTGKVVRSFDQTSGLIDGTVRALVRGGAGSVWIGTQQAGLQRLRAGAQRAEALSQDWPERRVRRLAPSRAGGVWVGLEVGLRHVAADGRSSQPLEAGPGVNLDQPVWAIVEDAEGGLWVGTPRGLLRREPSSSTLMTVPLVDGDASVQRVKGVLDVMVARSGEVWLLAQGGIYRGSRNSGIWSFALVVPSASVPQGLGAQLIEDRDGVIWTGRIRLDPRDGRLQALGVPEGFDAGNQVSPAGSLLDDGRLVFGSTAGLTIVAPDRFQQWRFEPNVVATTIEIDGRNARLQSGRLVVPSGGRRFAVEFAALDFSDPSLLRYRYRLEGKDDAWTTPSASQRVAAYGSLWPGDYVLRVQGSNRVGDWSPQELVMPIRVQAAFWQTPWFALAAVLALLGIVYGAVHWRGRRAARHERRLEALVDERTTELLAARNAAEGALVELRSAQRQLVEAEKMASLGQLVAGVAHELNTPMGNALVVSSGLREQAIALRSAVDAGQLKRSDLEVFLETLSEASSLIMRSIGRAHELVSNFKQVAVDRSSSQRRRFDLAIVVHEALEMLAPGLRHAAWHVESAVPEGIILDSYPGAIGQVVSNMVNNAALHAFPDGRPGVLRIEAERQEASGAVLLRFSDNGAGMDEDTGKRAFDPFFTTRMGRGGTGLGLNIVYNLATQLLGGSIGVHSTPGQGTCFELLIPLVAPAVEPPGPGD